MMSANWRDWYSHRRWRKRSRTQLRMFPLCALCLGKDKTVPATVADHVVPHKGDAQLFWYGSLRSLCAPCHNGRQAVHPKGVDASGWPLDPAKR
jgi:5-methylcytosine-specific restriction enzyme A